MNERVDAEESAGYLAKFQALNHFIPFLLPGTEGSNWYHTHSQWNPLQISEDGI